MKPGFIKQKGYVILSSTENCFLYLLWSKSCKKKCYNFSVINIFLSFFAYFVLICMGHDRPNLKRMEV